MDLGDNAGFSMHSDRLGVLLVNVGPGLFIDAFRSLNASANSQITVIKTPAIMSMTPTKIRNLAPLFIGIPPPKAFDPVANKLSQEPRRLG